MKLSDIVLGYNDGKDEALHIPNFEELFFDYNANYEKILKRDKFLLLGKKGTGKSILAEYIKKKSISESQWFCDVSSYKMFNFHELYEFRTNDVKPNEYVAIWEWIILLELGKLYLQDNSISSQYLNKFADFYKRNFNLDINANKIIEITKKGTISGVFKIFTGEIDKEVLSSRGSYLDYLENLKILVLESLQQSRSKYTLIFDELDDRFRNEDIYKSNIISLIKTTKNLNTFFLKNDVDCKIILLLRTDIFSILNDPDLNKVEQDNSVKIDWGKKANFDSPLFTMLINKIQKSNPALMMDKRNILISRLFPNVVNGRTTAEFVLGRTFFRPRDIITYLKLIVERYPDTSYFGRKGFLELEHEYSVYFLKEVKNELCGHFNEQQIDSAILLLSQFKTNFFMYDDIEIHYEKFKNQYGNYDLRELLKMLFDFSLLGNKWYNIERKKDYYTWVYREDIVPQIDYNKEFVIHLGLRKALKHI